MVSNFVFDVVVLGAGGGGCATAITAAREGASVALLSKESIGVGNTRMAGGLVTSSGIADGDSPDAFKEDMLRGGEYLNNLALVENLSKNATAGIQFVESLGQFFFRDEEGRLSGKSASRLGGHSFARSYTSSGKGVSITRALRHGVANTESIAVFEDTFAVSLLKEGNEIKGVLALDLKTSDSVAFWAKATILATGGCGWLYYPHTTNIRFATGDGYALAYEAGAELVDMEMVQIFPFAMNHPPHFSGCILGEPILAGPKGKLINGLGEVVLDGNINRMTRSQVTEVMAKEINAGRATKWGGLKLDLSGNLDVPDMLVFKQRMDDRYQKVRIAQGEAAYQWKEPWDVTPSVHYMMGGVKIDCNGRSNLEGLYAVGESAGGIMGANRLGSASIADVFVGGMAAGKEAARQAKESIQPRVDQALSDPAIEKIEGLIGKSGSARPIKLKRRLQKLMLDKVGIARDENSLSAAIVEIDQILGQAANDLAVSSIRRYNSELVDLLELNNMLTCAKMIATCARLRTESRGGHLRLDYPERDDAHWLKNIAVHKENGQLVTALHPISAREDYERKAKE